MIPTPVAAIVRSRFRQNHDRFPHPRGHGRARRRHHHAYQVQSTTDLASGSWSNLGAIQSGLTGVLTITNPIPPGVPRQFFRALESL
ncbi:MAG: hypothetical protein U1F98_07705 [Verrucomicrobiota bacterium]